MSNNKLDYSDLYLVRSPLQYLAASAAKQLSKFTPILVVEFDEPLTTESSKQLSIVVDEKEWSEVLYLNTQTRVSRFKTTRNMYNQLSKRKIKRVFIGEYRDIHFHLISTQFGESHYLLDDGATTIFIQKEYLSKRIVYPDFVGLSVKQLLYYFFLHRIIPKSVCFLKVFHLLTDFNLKNDRLLGQAVKKIPVTAIDNIQVADEVWLFGSKYYEAGIMSLDHELAYIEWAVNWCGDEVIKYIPHRGESVEKLSLLEKKGIDVCPLGLPVEEYIRCNKIHPKKIVAGWSTVLVTLPNRCNFKKVVCIEIPKEYIAEDVRERAVSIYDYYHSDSNVEVVTWADAHGEH